MALWAFFETATKATVLLLCAFVAAVFAAEDARLVVMIDSGGRVAEVTDASSRAEEGASRLLVPQLPQAFKNGDAALAALLSTAKRLPADTPARPPTILAVFVDEILRGMAPLAARAGITILVLGLPPSLGATYLPHPIVAQYARALSVVLSAGVGASEGGRLYVDVHVKRVGYSLRPDGIAAVSAGSDASAVSEVLPGLTGPFVVSVLRVVVTDEGAGFDAARASACVQQRQLDGARSVVRSIGGQLGAASVPGRGTTVWVDLPWDPSLAAHVDTLQPSWRFDDIDTAPLVWRRGVVACSLAPALPFAIPPDTSSLSVFAFGDVGSVNGKMFARTLAFISVDMVGSTSLYVTHGDEVALALILRFFAYVQRIVEHHNGAVIKTIGDAVLAVFQSPNDALEASLALLEGLRAFNAELSSGVGGATPLLGVGDALQLNVHSVSVPVGGSGSGSARPALLSADVHVKVGLNAGPAIAIGSHDGKLDYYGTTLNITSRVEALCNPGEIVSPHALVSQPRGEELLRAKRVRKNVFFAQLKGLVGSMELVRIAGTESAERSSRSSGAGDSFTGPSDASGSDASSTDAGGSHASFAGGSGGLRTR